ncbi:hypothetical protein RUND412_005780 [Rhizina undulata]
MSKSDLEIVLDDATAAQWSLAYAIEFARNKDYEESFEKIVCFYRNALRGKILEYEYAQGGSQKVSNILARANECLNALEYEEKTFRCAYRSLRNVGFKDLERRNISPPPRLRLDTRGSSSGALLDRENDGNGDEKINDDTPLFLPSSPISSPISSQRSSSRSTNISRTYSRSPTNVANEIKRKGRNSRPNTPLTRDRRKTPPPKYYRRISSFVQSSWRSTMWNLFSRRLTSLWQSRYLDEGRHTLMQEASNTAINILMALDAEYGIRDTREKQKKASNIYCALRLNKDIAYGLREGNWAVEKLAKSTSKDLRTKEQVERDLEIMRQLENACTNVPHFTSERPLPLAGHYNFVY